MQSFIKLLNKKLVGIIIIILLCLGAGAYSVFFAERVAPPIEVIHDLRKEGWAEVADGVFVSRGLVSENMTLVISEKEAAVIDTGALSVYDDDPKGIFRLRDYITEKDLVVKYVFFTHMDLDHIWGSKYFKNEHIENGSLPEKFSPENTEDGQIITMGDRVFKIVSTPGHSTLRGGHISVELVNEHILASGDVLYSNFVPGMLECDKSQDLLDSLYKIKKESYDIIIPGHGNIVDPVRLVDRNIKYLKKARKLVKNTINSGGTLNDVYKRIEVRDCTNDLDQINLGDSRNMHRSNIKVIYDELMGNTKTIEQVIKERVE